MTKRIISIAVAVMLVVLGSVCAFAAEEPKVTADTVCYISFQTGNNDYDGLSAETPKKQLLTTEDNAAMGVLKDGGTLVAVGKLYIGGDYSMPELGSTLKITSNDGKANYKNGIPFENPSCAMKMKTGATLTLQSDVILDDLILFQEGAMNTIKVTNNSTLVIGDKIECMSNLASLNPCYMAIDVEKGSTVILNGGTFEQITGEGTIINNGATIQSESAETTSAPEETTAAPEVTTEATSAATSAADKPVGGTTVAPDNTDATGAPEDTTAASESTDETAAESKEETKATTKEETKATEDKAADTAASTEASATAPAASDEGGVNVGLIIGIVAAVIVVAVVVIVIVTKKKK